MKVEFGEADFAPDENNTIGVFNWYVDGNKSDYNDLEDILFSWDIENVLNVIIK